MLKSANNRITLALAAVLALPLVACSDDDDPPAAGGSGGSADLNGTWVSGCSVGQKGDGEVERYSFSGNYAQVQSDTYLGDSSCSTLTFSLTAIGTFNVGQSVTTSTGGSATQIDVSVTSITVTIFGAQSVANINANEFCGRADWQDGVSMDVTTCERFSGFGGNFYDIYRVDGSVLYLGDDSGNYRTPQTRPTDVDVASPYTRSAG